MTTTVHYAPQIVKCLSHRAFGYAGTMDTPNQRLRWLRESRFPTMEEAATFLGVNISTYRQHENDTRGLGGIPRKAAEHYARKFRVSLDWLMTGRGDEPANLLPTEEQLEAMVRELIEREVTLTTRVADLAPIIGRGLKKRLEQYASGEPLGVNGDAH